MLLTDTLCNASTPDRAVVLMVRSPDTSGTTGVVGDRVGAAVAGGVRSTTFKALLVPTNAYLPSTATSQDTAGDSVVVWRMSTVGCSGVLTSITTSSVSEVRYKFCP